MLLVDVMVVSQSIPRKKWKFCCKSQTYMSSLQNPNSECFEKHVSYRQYLFDHKLCVWKQWVLHLLKSFAGEWYPRSSFCKCPNIQDGNDHYTKLCLQSARKYQFSILDFSYCPANLHIVDGSLWGQAFDGKFLIHFRLFSHLYWTILLLNM